MPELGNPKFLPLRKILAPTDFSDPSLGALGYAAQLSRHFKADLQLLHVVMRVQPAVTPGFPHSVRAPARQKELEDAAMEKLRRISGEHLPVEAPVEFIVVPGDPADTIIDISREKDSDLIVIATHGESGWKRALFGSVADSVIRNADCPVLSIRYHQDRQS